MSEQILALRNGDIEFSDEPTMCESCGSNAIGAFEPYYNDGDTTWCSSCACSCTYDPDEYISEDEAEIFRAILSEFEQLRDNFGRKKIIAEIPKVIKKIQDENS